MDSIVTFANSGLNQDDDLIALPSGDSRYRLNIVLTEDQNKYTIVNTKGRTLKSITLPNPVSEIKVIGFVCDEENRTGIYALYCYYNTTKYHSFIEYSVDDDSVTYLLDGSDGSPTVGSILDFPDGNVDMAIIGNGDDKYLAWVDGVNEPRLANITMMRNYTSGSGTPAYSVIYGQTLSMYKKPYTGNIGVSYGYDSSYDGNNVFGYLFQFSIRKKYYDNSYTTISPYSLVAIPSSSEVVSGRVTQEFKNNKIIVQFAPDDDDINVVDYYQLLYRIADISGGDPGNWYIYRNIDDLTPVLGIVYVDFYNDNNIGVVSSDEASRVFDYVPLTSSCIESIDSNRIVLNVGKEGYDNVDYNNTDQWDVSVSETTPYALSNNGVSYLEFELLDTASESKVFTFSDVDDTDFSYHLTISTDDPVGDSYFLFESSYNFDNDDVFTEFMTLVNAKSYAELTATHTSSNTLTFTHDSSVNYYYYVYLVILYTGGKNKTLKTGSSYVFGIRYGFGGRFGYVLSNDDLKLNTMNIGDVYPVLTDNGYTTNARININHLAPSGATDYQIVCLGNNIDYFEDYFVYFSATNIFDSSSEYDLYMDGYRTIIRKNYIVNKFRDAYKDGISYGFTFAVGDVVRFIGRCTNTSHTTTLFPSTQEFEILAVDSTNIYISPSAGALLESKYSGEVFFHIQIIRFKDNFGSGNGVYQEFSSVFRVDENGYHAGNTTNGSGDVYQTASYPAIVNITTDFADSFKSPQVYVNAANYSSYGLGNAPVYSTWMELNRFSLYYDSYISSHGRVNTINESAAQISPNQIRFGGKFLDNTGVSFFSKFDYDDVRDLDEKYGSIVKIHQFGSTLRIFQERKVTSFYLGAITSVDSNGNILTSSSGEVMDNNGRPFVHHLGCTHYSSFASTIKTEYFFDLNNASVVRGTVNGLDVVSDYKMHSFFESLTKRILQEAGISNVRITGGFNNEYDMYMITFYDTRGTNNDDINYTLGFNEEKNRWISFYNYYPEFYGSVSGKYNLSFNDGVAYHDFSNSTRTSAVVRVHNSENANLIKIWDSIAINSTNQWYPDESGDIVVTIPEEMKSRLKPGRFQLQEGEYRSDFLMDMLSGSSTPQENNLFNGRPLRGYDIYVDLRYEGTGKAVLRLVRFTFTPSL